VPARAVETVIRRDARRRHRAPVARHLPPYLLLLPSVVLLVAFFAVPLVSLFYYGLREVDLSGRSEYVGGDNFRTLFSEDRFVQNLGASAQYLIGVLVISVPLGYLAAGLITQRVRGIGILRTLFLVPWILAPVVTALLVKTLIDPTSGPVTRLLSWTVGRPVYPTLEPHGAMVVVIVHSAWRSFPLVMLILAAGMMSIPRELYEAVRVDGGNWWREFRDITLPLTRAPLLASLVVISVFTLNDTETVYALTQGGPAYDTEVTAVRLFKEAFLYFNVGTASSIGVVLMAVTIVVLVFHFLVAREKKLS
jgi:multiple sugar transport system permease protein